MPAAWEKRTNGSHDSNDSNGSGPRGGPTGASRGGPGDSSRGGPTGPTGTSRDGPVDTSLGGPEREREAFCLDWYRMVEAPRSRDLGRWSHLNETGPPRDRGTGPPQDGLSGPPQDGVPSPSLGDVLEVQLLVVMHREGGNASGGEFRLNNDK